MESKLNYTIVGIFMALLLAGLFAFVFWLNKHNSNQQYDYYYVYMTESVSGLSTDSSVKYMGVDVGVVTQIDINPVDSEQVRLLLQIQQGTPIKVETRASLRFYGVTGLAFIELTGARKESALLKQSQTDGIPVIKESASLFSNIEQTLNDLAKNSSDVLEKIDRLLSPDNLNNVDEILQETKSLIETLSNQQPKISSLLDNSLVVENSIDEAFKRITIAVDSVAEMAKDLANNSTIMQAQFNNTLLEINQASNSVEQMADSFKQNYADNGQNINNEVERSLISFRQSLKKIDSLVFELERTTRSIKESPSDLLLKYSQPKLGPGEEVYDE